MNTLFTRFLRPFCHLKLVLLCGASLAQAEPIEWELIEPDVSGIPDFGSCIDRIYGHDGWFYAYVCLGSDPWEAVYRSRDGVSWERVVNGTRATTGFTLSDGRVLLYGYTGDLVMQGTDGWTLMDLAALGSEAENSAILSVAEGGGRIVLGGVQSYQRSPRPVSWVSTDGGQSFSFHPSTRSFGFGSEPGLADIAFGNGLFVAVGVSGEVWISPNGETWAENTLPAVPDSTSGEAWRFSTVQFLDGAFWASGNYTSIHRSTNGSSWETVHRGEENHLLDTFFVDGDHWHAAGFAVAQAWSADRGATWNSTTEIPAGFQRLIGGNGIVFLGGLFAPSGDQINPETEIVYDIFPTFVAFSQLAHTEGKWMGRKGGDYYLGIDQAARFLDSATAINAVFNEHPWFGRFAHTELDWVYHLDLGWTYTRSPTGLHVWLFVPGLSWIYTSKTLWPHFYHAASGHWGRYSGQTDSFWNVSLQTWQSRSGFGPEP